MSNTVLNNLMDSEVGAPGVSATKPITWNELLAIAEGSKESTAGDRSKPVRPGSDVVEEKPRGFNF